ncbi:uncharacterized protein LOC143538276 [Bidens hawaiensis]|uniref:uncharacterized protein LOC143538276 n=1 Tax=Bidens hawaiensis TaxID=980011 RepID=UPI0040492483
MGLTREHGANSCEEVEETVDHILVSCGLAQSLWCLIAQWCKVPPPFLFSFQDVLDLHNFVPVPREKAKIFQAICLCTSWCLWKSRNALVHNGVRKSLNGLVEEVKVVSYLWVKNRGKKANISWEKWRRFEV